MVSRKFQNSEDATVCAAAVVGELSAALPVQSKVGRDETSGETAHGEAREIHEIARR